MEVYADGLIKALESRGTASTIHIPCSKLERFHQNSWVMRYLRYQHYPLNVRKNQRNDTQIHHVIDHGYAHLIGSLGQGKKVLSVHDLIPFLTWRGVIKKSDGSSFSQRKPRLNLHSLKFIQSYDHIVTVSQNTANDINTYLGIDKKIISVTPPVIDRQFIPASDDEVNVLRSKYNLTQDTKWLMISGSEFYKNCLLYTSPSPRDKRQSRMPSSA